MFSYSEEVASEVLGLGVWRSGQMLRHIFGTSVLVSRTTQNKHMGLGDSSAGEVLSVKAQGPELKLM